MRWYQMLFWRIFGAVWSVSMLGILMSLVLYLAISDSQERQLEQTERVEQVAERVLDAYESQSRVPRHGGRHPPIWIYDASEKLIFGMSPKPPPKTRSLNIESESGAIYRVLFNPNRETMILDRFLGFILSLQAIWVLAVSLAVSLFLAWMIVRPINALRNHVRSLYERQNLSFRAEGRLSQRSDELGELAREFNEMADAVEQTFARQETLLRDVSHELRAPLARLRVANGLAEQRWGEDEKVLQRISAECDHLERLISELLALSREENATSEDKLDLRVLVDSLIEDARLIGPEHNFLLNTDIGETAYRIYREPLSRILSNLLVNAVWHTPSGTQVAVFFEVVGQELRLTVTDTGPGVSEDFLRDMGQPFKRSPDSRGYGIGLSICKKAAERAGGSLSFSNQVSGGLKVSLTLPLANRSAATFN